jgi:hypothetical protein
LQVAVQELEAAYEDLNKKMNEAVEMLEEAKKSGGKVIASVV